MLGNAKSWYDVFPEVDYIIGQYPMLTSFHIEAADLVFPVREWLEEPIGEHDPAQHPVAAERVRAHRRDGVALHPSRAGGGEMRGEDGGELPVSSPDTWQRHRGGGQGLRRRDAARAQLGRAGEGRRQVRALRHAGQRVLPLRPT